MKTVEVLGPMGVIGVRESDLRQYKSRGFTLPDGKPIVTPQEKEAARKAKAKKKPAKE